MHFADDELKDVDARRLWADIEKDFAAHEAAAKRSEAVFSKISKRSPLNWTENQLMHRAGLSGDFEALRKNACRMMHYPGDSVAVEKMMQSVADTERDSANKRQSPAAMWRGLQNSTVLKEQFQFGRVIEASDVPDDQPAKAKLPEAVFKPRAASATLKMNDLASQNDPTWQTCSAPGWQALVPEQNARGIAVTTNVATTSGIFGRLSLWCDTWS